MGGRLNNPKYLVANWPLNGHARDVVHGNDLSWTSGPAYDEFRDGKLGADLDGTDDKIGSADLGNIRAIRFRAKPASDTEPLVKLAAGKYIATSSGTITYTGVTASATYVDGRPSTSLGAGEERDIICVFDADVGADAAEIGTDGTNFGEILIGRVRPYNIALTAEEANELANMSGPLPIHPQAQPYPQYQPYGNPVGAWGFAGGNGFKDVSGNGNDGTPSGGVKVDADGGFEFVNTGRKVDIGTPLNTFPLTLMAWVKTTDTSAPRSVLGNYRGGSFNGIFIFLHSGRLKAWYFSGPDGNVDDFTRLDNDALDGGFIADGEWHLVACTVDSSGGKIYVDADLINESGVTGTLATSTSTEDFIVGALSVYANFIGSIREIPFYNSALSQPEIEYIYRQGVPDDTLLFHSVDGRPGSDLSKHRRTINHVAGARSLNDSLILNGSEGGKYMDDFIGTGDISVAATIFPEGWGESGFGRILDNGKFLVFVNDAADSIRVQSDGSTNASTAANSISLNIPYRIGVRRASDGTTNIFINGVRSGDADQDSGTPAAGTTDLYWGNRAADDRTFDGWQRNLKVFEELKSDDWFKKDTAWHEAAR